ncbi:MULTISPECIES: TetR/AcrR family transcriptional regulator [Acinetobacter]|uniref:TetR/AcrR family transcriptional regulator n=1 Tax=Acinetobacter TaxID=469 RepID=UPI001F05A27C|nr:TetR/AcrR family transcriptional regulator [Acinetobacter oleivorans]MCH2003699.1 TetR/AcrR family transcriptional regulator [Acinetobacter seifertii]WQF74893.1 TetR/AcrR family transcriptional regulator [Acinetobacter oleivorans]
MIVFKPRGKRQQIIDTAIPLFTDQGFHNVGIDTIVRESRVSKSTLYKHFPSKENMIEISLYVNKQFLQEEVEDIIDQSSEVSVSDKLKQIFLLHSNLNSPYHLLLRAIIEIKDVYPLAFGIVTKYRTWLVNAIHLLINQSKPSADFQDAQLFLFIIDGSFNLLLNPELAVENDLVLSYFLKKVCPK